MVKKRIFTILQYAVVIFIGGIIYAFAFNWLFQPNQIVTGGFTGIGQVVHRLIPVIPVGAVSITLNIPMFLILAKKQGLSSCFASLCAMLTGATLIDIFASWFTFQPMENKFLACVYAGILFGLPIGIQLRINVTTGGSDLLARLLKYKFHHIPVGRLCLFLDLSVVTLYAIVFQSLDGALYGIIAMYVASITVDAVVYGGRTAKMAVIISERNDELVQALTCAQYGVTRIEGRGGYKGRKKEVLISTFRNNQITGLKRIVTTVDPESFVVVCDAHEVIGEGFGAYSEDEL